MEEIKKDWTKRRKALLEKANALIDFEKADQGFVSLKANGYIREISIIYDAKKYLFSPGQFIVNKTDEKIMYCIGLGKSPNMASEEALWFVSEVSDSIMFIDVKIPNIISQELIPTTF